MAFLKSFFCSPSIPFNYESQLSKDHSQLYTRTSYPDKPDEIINENKIENGSLPRRKKTIGKLINSYSQEENNGKGYTTLIECFQRGLSKFPKTECLGTRIYNDDGKRGKFVFETYEEINKRILNLGFGLIKLGLSADSKIGIYSYNRPEWTLTAFAAYSQSMQVVALYATLGDQAVEYIFEHAELEIVFVSSDSLEHVLKVAPNLKKLKTIVQYDFYGKYNNKCDSISKENIEKAEKLGLKLIGFSEIEKMGSETSTDTFPNYPNSETLAQIQYTSGTTGPPKGVLLTHGNIVASVATVPYIADFTAGDRHLSYLPLAHIFETIVQVSMLANGATIGFFQNNIKMLTGDLVELQPTFLAGVPRVFNRIYQTVFNTVGQRGFLVRYLFNRSYNSRLAAIREGGKRSESRIFKKLSEKVGLGKVKYIISGAAPLPPYLHEFLQVITSALVLQGYGMTESGGAISVTDNNDFLKGHVGSVIPSGEIKLVSIPEMGYTTEDNNEFGYLTPRGEIWYRGANVFKGYYKDDKNTSETLIDGWLRTGDVGRINPNGTLSIIDRAKNLLKLSQGEYVAVERIESTYGQSPAVGQLWVYGNSFKSFLLGVLVPNADFVSQYAQANGFWTGGDSRLGDEIFTQAYYDALTGSRAEELKNSIVTSLREQEKTLKGFEKVTDFIIEPKINNLGLGFTEDNESLTPTFKLKRNMLLKRYVTELKELYGKHKEPVAPDEQWPGEK